MNDAPLTVIALIEAIDRQDADAVQALMPADLTDAIAIIEALASLVIALLVISGIDLHQLSDTRTDLLNPPEETP